MVLTPSSSQRAPTRPAFLPSVPLFSAAPSSTSLRATCAVRNAPIAKAAASADQHTTVLVVPTGIGASIGGYAGDALPTARLLASVTDTLITHPNVLNGALLYWPIPNALYVEGQALDSFCCDRLALRPVAAPSNRVGLLLDAAMDPEARIRHLQAADAARATLGLRIGPHTVTDSELGVSYASSGDGHGASWGTVQRPDALLRAARRLVDEGCDAIAIVAEFPDEDEEHLAEYRAGGGVDAIAGAEAVLSHLVSKHLGVPCAHAPSLPPLPADESVSPKAAAEELGYTFLSCVLVGLARAPRLAATDTYGAITAASVDAVVVPASAFGGAATMELAARKDVLVVAVENNRTVLNVPPGAVGADRPNVVYASSYLEAAGIVAANRAGLELRSLSERVPQLRELRV